MPVTIAYFPAKARVGFALPAFAGKIDWKFQKITGAEWGKQKDQTPLGQLPVMTLESGEQIAQSGAIYHYLGKQGNLLGSNDVDYCMSEQLVAQAEDICTALIANNPRMSSKETPSTCTEFWTNVMVRLLGPLEKMVKDGKFTSELTLGELILFWAINLLVDCKPDVLANTPGLKVYYDRIASSEAGTKYLEWCKNEGLMTYFYDPTITVTYFGVKARTGFALPAFAGNLNFRYNKCTDWPAAKDDTPFGQLPIITLPSGETYGQSLAIYHYLGREAGLLGKTSQEYLMSEQLLQQGEDIYMQLCYFNPRLSSKDTPATCAEFWKNGVNKLLAPLEKLVKDGKFTQDLTLGELILFWGLNLLVDIKPEVLDATPGVKAFYERIAQSDAGKKYLEFSAAELKPYFLKPEL